MALIKCPECGEKISDKATACIHCGYPLKEKEKKVSKTILKNEEIDKSLDKWLHEKYVERYGWLPYFW